MAEVPWQKFGGHNVKLQAQCKKTKRDSHFIEIYSISWLGVNAAVAENKSNLMYQTSLGVREG